MKNQTTSGNIFRLHAPFQRNVVAIGVQISIPIFSAKTRADIALAKSQLNAAELTLSAKRQQVSLEVQQRTRTVRELDATREVARLDLQLAQENVQLLQAKFDQGNVTLRDMEQARLDENDKWVAFLDANFARQQGQLEPVAGDGAARESVPIRRNRCKAALGLVGQIK